jgi:hypothetical protein
VRFTPLPVVDLIGNVRFGSLADICSAKGHVRFAPNSDRKSEFPQKVMSALPPKADMCGATRDVRFGPIADMMELLLDHLVGLSKYQAGNFDTLCFCRFCIHDEFKSCRLFNRQFTWLCAFQNFVDVGGSTVKPFLNVR